MAESYIYKPATRKGPVFLAPVDSGPPVITGPDGTKYVGVRADQKGGAFFNEGRYQFVFDDDVIGLKGATLSYGDESFPLESGGQSYEGSSLSSLAPRDKGSVGSAGSSGIGGGPTTDSTGLGFAPADLTGQFPSPVLTNYDPIAAAPYEFTDPMAFTKAYAPFARDQLNISNEQAKEFAYSALDTELKSLQSFIPQQAELKRQQTDLDNFFNQEQRLRQVEQGVPGARQDLEAQRLRAQGYAKGQLPDSNQDRALELGLRGDAADRASSAGFGASSSVSRKASDLMSAEKRFQISQYGEQLTGQNVNARAGLLLAPTEYSNAGQQINVNPSVSPAQLQTQARQEISQQTGVSTTQALSTNIQQNQFTTNLEQQTRTFNASNTLQNDQFNATNENSFALNKFGYKVSLAGAQAGAAQTGSNAQIAIDQQKRAEEIYKNYQSMAQSNVQLKTVLSAITALAGGSGSAASAITGIKDILNSLGLTIGSGEDSSTDTGGARPPRPEGATGPDPTEGGTRTPDEVDTTGPEEPDDINAPDSSSSDTSSDSGETSTGGGDSLGGSAADAGRGLKTRSATLSKDEQLVKSAYTNDTGLSLTKADATTFSHKADRVMNSAGMSHQPSKDNVAVGVDFQGRTLYSNKKMAANQNTNAGQTQVEFFKKLLDPTGVFSKEDSTTLDKIGVVASDASFLLHLSELQSKGDKKGFVNEILKKYKNTIIDSLANNKQDKAAYGAAFSAYQLFQGWDKMSGAQKSIGLANLGLQSYQGATGVDLAKMPIPGTGANGTPSLTVGQTLGLVSAGYNVYNLINNWDQLSDVQKVMYGTSTAANLAATAKDLGLLTSSSSTAGGTAAAGGGSASGSAGGGGAASGGIGAAGYVAGGIAVAAGAYQVYQGWGEGGARGRANGALGGATMAAGMYALGATNPYVLAAVVAISIASNSIKTGKEQHQVKRDFVRGAFKKSGLIDDNYNVTLADGSTVDIGIDGRGGQHAVTDPSKLSGKMRGDKLHSYDLDYTNDLDYASGMGGVALSRLLTGGKAINIDQLGNQLGNAAISNIGYGKEMNEANYNKMIANQRAMYAKSGIGSKKDAYSLAQVAFDEGRINATDLVTMQQGFNMVFDDAKQSYATAQKLMNGRHRGIEVASESAQGPMGSNPADSGFPNRPGTGINPRDPSTFPASQNSNTPLDTSGFVQYGRQAVNPRDPSTFPSNAQYPSRPGSEVTDNGNRPAQAAPTGPSAAPARRPARQWKTREEIIEENKRRYAGNYPNSFGVSD